MKLYALTVNTIIGIKRAKSRLVAIDLEDLLRESREILDQSLSEPYPAEQA